MGGGGLGYNTENQTVDYSYVPGGLLRYSEHIVMDKTIYLR